MLSPVAYNSRNAFSVEGISSHDTDTYEFVLDVQRVQRLLGIEDDGKLGPKTICAWRQHIKTKGDKIGLDKLKISEMISRFEGKAWSVNRDGEFRGLFGKDHWAYQKTHIGLSFGTHQFTQSGGSLGRLLKKMHKANPAEFEKRMGPHWKELISVTNKFAGISRNGRNRRVQKVGGYDLWEDYWVDRLVSAVRNVPKFVTCQRELAIEDYMNPALKNAKKLGISTERGIAILFDRSVQHGPSGAVKLFNKKIKIESEMLWDMYTRHSSRSWSHRTLKLWRSSDLSDNPVAKV